MIPPFVVPYLIGLATAPLVVKIIKPLARSTVKATIEIGLQAKKLAAETAEDLQDLAAEASVEMAAAETNGRGSGVSAKRSGVSAMGR